MIALEAKSLKKCYTAVPAVSEITFSLRPGEVLGCLGPNGAGKSTIVRMLTGLSEPTRGYVFSLGTNIHKDLVAYRRRLGYVPEEPELYSFLSGWEYLELVGTLRGMERRQMEKKIDALLSLFSLAPHRHSSIGSYSKGMRQRILLIAALMHDPQILILDEPLSGLDVISAIVVKNLIKTLGEHGKAIFYCSHVLEVVEKVCSHVMVLRKGRVIAHAPTAELQTMVGQRSLEHAFIHLVADRDAHQTATEIVEVMSAS
jgi:ABC-2 type transport system ATP-binding protein